MDGHIHRTQSARFHEMSFELVVRTCRQTRRRDRRSDSSEIEGNLPVINSGVIDVACAITDFRCQGRTFNWVLCNVEKVRTGPAPPISAYVQFKAKPLEGVSIMRPFNVDKLSIPLPSELLEELRWESEMAENKQGSCIYYKIDRNFINVA
jgi:hypothetical protein